MAAKTRSNGTGRGVATRLRTLQSSPTLAVTTLAKELRAAGKDVIGLGAGEPDFDTPEFIKEAARKALADGWTKYPPVAGIAPLREAIAAEVATYTDAPVETGSVVVSVGGKHALYQIFQAILEPGDEVIIPSPYWVSYPAQVQLADGNSAIVPTDIDQGFRVEAEQVRAAITPRTRAIVVNSPSNPTGAALPWESLKAIAGIAVAHDLWIISDDIYREIVYPPFEWRSIATLGPEVRDRTIIVNGVSKSYAMTGWRIGWSVAPLDVAKAISRLQSQSTSGATSIAQYAALAAVTGPRNPVHEMAAAFLRRRDLVLDLLQQGGLKVHRPEGAFYLFPEVRAASEAAGGSVELASRLVEEFGVAAVPGAAFGAEGFLRISFAASDETLREGLRRLIEGTKTIAG